MALGAQAQEKVVDPFGFTSDAGLILWQIKPDAAADFEMVWRVIRQRVEASASPEIRAMVAGMKMYVPGVPPGEALTYVFHVDPAIRTASYSPTFLLYESKLFERAEADELFKKMTATLVAEGSITMMPLNYAK